MSNANEKQNIDELKVHTNAWYVNYEDTSVRVMKIPGYDYWAGIDGNVYSFKGKGIRRLKAHDNGIGYLKIRLSTPLGMVSEYLHRLVANAWLENGGTDYWGNIRNEINHIDGDKSNNKPTNLERCSKFENMQHLSNVLKSQEFQLRFI